MSVSSGIWHFRGKLGRSRMPSQLLLFLESPASIYLLKVSNRNIRTRCEICSKLPVKPLESFWCLYCWLWKYVTPCSSIFIINFEHVIACWELPKILSISSFKKPIGKFSVEKLISIFWYLRMAIYK